MKASSCQPRLGQLSHILSQLLCWATTCLTLTFNLLCGKSTSKVLPFGSDPLFFRRKRLAANSQLYQKFEAPNAPDAFDTLCLACRLLGRPTCARSLNLGFMANEVWRPSLLGWRPSLLGWRPLLLGWKPLLLGWRPGVADANGNELLRLTARILLV